MRLRLFLLLLTLYTLECIKCRGGGPLVYTFNSEEENIWPLQVKANSRITLKILGNPTTGYEWFVNRAKLDSSFIKPVRLAASNRGRFTEPTVPFGFTGAPGYYSFDFDTLDPGKTTVEFFYRRPWETEPERRLRANLEIV
jgi:predicted secreted protein